MEFPTAMLGVALGVVLMPLLASAKAADDAQRYSALLDWGLRIVVLMSVPCAIGLLIFSKPLVAVLYHYGAFTAFDVQQTSLAMMGWGAGLVGIVAIKVLAPGYYASQDIKTPVRIAVVVLVITQLLNMVFVPLFKGVGAGHAALSLSIGIGALINAVWLLVGLIRRKSYTPEPGWGLFALQVLAGSALLVIYLLWAANAFAWIELRSESFKRIGLLALLMVGAAVVYLGAVWAAGLNPRQFLRRE
jgi:putative peptidoglycan lipid II flippase